MTFSKLSENQKKVFKWCYRNENKAIICDGAVRSGKTISMVTSFILWAMRKFNKCNFGICGKTIASAERNIVLPLFNIADIVNYFTLKHTKNRIYISDGKHENIFFIFGGKDESSYELLQGITLSGILLDEVALMPESFVNQAIARCLSVEDALYWFNCNPENPKHWFYQNWIKNPEEKNALYIHFTMEDNPILSQKQIDEAKKQFSGVFYDRYILGLWTNTEGIIYRQFANHTDMFLIDEPDTFLNTIAIGIDYGAGRSKTSMKAVGFDSGSKNVFVLDEYDKDGIFDPDTLYKRFHAFYKKVVEKYGKCQYVLADWGGLGNMLNEGLYVYCRKNAIPVRVEDCDKGTILDRIQLTQKLMAEHRLFIRRECKNMIKALSDALWDDKKPDTRLDDGTTDIDSLDAFEYAVYMFKNYLLKAVKYQ